MCFHPQRSGAAWPKNINTRQAGKTHLFACLSVTSATSESHFHKSKKKKKITIKRRQPCAGILWWRPRQELQLNPNSGVVLHCGDNRKSTTMSRNRKTQSRRECFFFSLFHFGGQLHMSGGELHDRFTCSLKNNNATRREGNLSVDISQAQEQRD